MKRIFIFLAVLTLCAAPAGRAQDAATEQRLNELSGKLEELKDNLDAQHKQIEEVRKIINSLREKIDKPAPDYASVEDLNRVDANVKKVDRARIGDFNNLREEQDKLRESIKADLDRLRKVIDTPLPPPPPPKPSRSTHISNSTDETPSVSNSNKQPENITEPLGPTVPYIIQKGDTISAILEACKEKGYKVTVAQIKKYNPGLNPEKLYAGKKILIPIPNPPQK
jgi:LysM repeat protein